MVLSFQENGFKEITAELGIEQSSGLWQSVLAEDLTELKSVLYLNDGIGHLEKNYLPFEAQTYPVKAIHTFRYAGGTGQSDLLLGGNLFDVKPSTGGRQDAGQGTFIRMDEYANLATLPMQSSGFYSPGEIRNIRTFRTVHGNMIMIARNNEEIAFFIER